MVAAERRALAAPAGCRVPWHNPDTGHRGDVTVVRHGRDSRTGEYCREYQTKVTVGGRSEDAYGLACRQPDGSWKIVRQSGAPLG